MKKLLFLSLALLAGGINIFGEITDNFIGLSNQADTPLTIKYVRVNFNNVPSHIPQLVELPPKKTFLFKNEPEDVKFFTKNNKTIKNLSNFPDNKDRDYIFMKDPLDNGANYIIISEEDLQKTGQQTKQNECQDGSCNIM